MFTPRAVTAALVCCIALASAAAHPTFEEYLKRYGKSYPSHLEYRLHKEAYEASIRRIEAHNADPSSTYRKGVNQFSDVLEGDRFMPRGYNKGAANAKGSLLRGAEMFTYSESELAGIPDSLDWRERGVISSVKNQGSCGSCWTFGTTELIESYMAIYHGVKQDLSMQQLVDCVDNSNECGGSGGCLGATVPIALDYIIGAGGQLTEWTYSYRSFFYGYTEETFQCMASNYSSMYSTAIGAVVDSYKVLPSNDPTAILLALQRGPVAVNVDASSWHDYESGVYTGCSTENVDIDHVVLLVGYGTTTQGVDYYIIRNSWGPGWGEEGYIRLARYDNILKAPCGPDSTPLDGTSCVTDDPSTIENVCGECGVLFQPVGLLEVSPYAG